MNKKERKFKKQIAQNNDYLLMLREVIKNPKKIKTAVLNKRDKKRYQSSVDYNNAKTDAR